MGGLHCFSVYQHSLRHISPSWLSPNLYQVNLPVKPWTLLPNTRKIIEEHKLWFEYIF